MKTIIFDDSEITLPADPSVSTIPGKLFEAGDYPDKGVSITEADLDAAVEAFAAAPMNYEHKAGILDGALGSISRVWRDGASLLADFQVPHFLRDFAKAQGTPLKVSAEWDKASKRLTGAAWTLNPRIKDAELVAAFSTAQAVAPTTVPPVVVPPAQTHQPPPPIVKVRLGDTHMTTAENTMRDMVNAGTLKMSETEIVAMFSEDNAAAEKRRAADIASEAARRAEALITGKKAMPYERAALVAAFSQAGSDDAAQSGTITFSLAPNETKTGSRVDLLDSVFGARIPHNLDAELMSPDLDAATLAKKLADAKVVFSTTTTDRSGAEKPITTERKAELLSLTSEGKAALAAGVK